MIMAGLYIHIPFCKRKCLYCDFYSCTSLARKDELLEALLREMAMQRDFLGSAPLRTLYIGGGTPSVYTPEQLQRLIERAGELWSCASFDEVTAEVNPDDLTPEYVAALTRTGIGRLSIGIQSFVDRHLQFMNRRHTAQAAVDAVHRVQDAGFRNVTIDLIYGIPGMTSDEWAGNLEQALRLQVQHISAYHLTFEPGTEFGRRLAAGKLCAVDEEVSCRQYMMLHERLTAAGFEHYEISNFARPGYRARHNSAYWSGEPYLGIGPSAHSFDGRNRRWVVSSVERYQTAGDDALKLYEGESLTDTDRYNEYLMTSLRRIEGLSAVELERRFGARKLRMFCAEAERFVAGGVMIHEGEHYRIPPENFLISDGIICDLFADGCESEPLESK